MAFALTGARIFDGAHWLDGHAVVVEGARIAAVTPEQDLPAAIERRAVDGLLAPGFIDVQVNGGGGVLFNDARTVEGIRAIGRAHRRFGTTGFLPTFITDTSERMGEAVAAVREAIRRRVPGVLGIHLEGPFLNPARKGVHESAHMRPLAEEDLRLMTSLGEGATLVTLAPERVPPDAIRRLAAAGVVVSAGHTAAKYGLVHEAIRQGLRGFTHLFNAMPPLAGREPGPVGAALNSRETWCGLIVDGHHVDDASLRIAIAAKGPDRMMLVTDAMPTVGTDLPQFELLGRTVHRTGGRLTLADGTLAGSDLDMASAVRNAVRRLGLSLPQALRMASRVPAAFLRLGQERGCIAPGTRADLVLLDSDLAVLETWIGGKDSAADAE
jgi:N-acetylglucosamine-6-phosphate deacetylase